MEPEGGGGARGGGGLGVRLLPPGRGIEQDDAPLLLGGVSDMDPEHGHPYHRRPRQRKQPPLHWAVAGLILFGFSAPAALVTVPFAMGAAGFLLGTLALVVLTAATAGGALMLLEIYLAHPWCQNMPELGEAAMVRVVCVRKEHRPLSGPANPLDRSSPSHTHVPSHIPLQGRVGKRVAATCQMINFIGFLPVALYIAGGALQVLLT